MKILITGAGGQLGWELQRTISDGFDVIALKSSDLDITNDLQVQEAFSTFSPQVIINAAAYTAVDKAEEERDKAFAVNAEGAKNLANAARESGARLIHVSTDFVFDGQNSSPYKPFDSTNPTGVYGESKLSGEEKIIAITGLDNCAIVRTAWVYSAHGNNFVKTMLRLMAERDELGIVADQVGTPTWAKGLARCIWGLVSSNQNGMFHWTDAGVASWYDFSVAIYEEALALGLLKKKCIIAPIATSDYPTPAKRPPFSVLDKSETWSKLDLQPQHWRESLREMLKKL